MTKEELSTRWGSYTDTDKLVDDIRALLTHYSHRNTEHGVCKMLDTYFTNKEPLIRLLKGVDGFDENLRLITTKDFDRVTDINVIQTFLNRFINTIITSGMLVTNVDKDGKTFKDYLKTGIPRFNISQLEDRNFVKTFNEIQSYLSAFDSNGNLIESVRRKDKWVSIMYIFDGISKSSLDEERASEICKKLDSKKYAAGLKTSRAFNRVCEEFGVTAHKDYNKKFAEYADMVAGGTRKLDFVVSLNPYDYLTMSFGNSWSSCHTIDKGNLRGMPNNYSGQYCGGTISYMLDKTSIITYVVDKGADPQTSGKIYRNMFHYEDGLLVQGRVYPQGNDGATDLYTTFRTYMHDVLNDAINPTDTIWEHLIRGNCGSYTYSDGAHYKDYQNYSSCNVSRLNNGTHNETVHIGHYGICPYCGERFTSSNTLAHSSCTIRE